MLYAWNGNANLKCVRRRHFTFRCKVYPQLIYTCQTSRNKNYMYWELKMLVIQDDKVMKNFQTFQKWNVTCKLWKIPKAWRYSTVNSEFIMKLRKHRSDKRWKGRAYTLKKNTTELSCLRFGILAWPLPASRPGMSARTPIPQLLQFFKGKRSEVWLNPPWWKGPVLVMEYDGQNTGQYEQPKLVHADEH